MIDLNNVHPISYVASRLAALIKALASHPVIITQKGRPTAVLLSVDAFEEYMRLKAKAEDVNGSR